MSEKRVTISLVQITKETRPEGLAAKFELVDTVQEAIDAKLAEGRNE